MKTLTFQYDLKVTKCHCGSGKKPERCCGPIGPRTHSVELDSRNFYESEGFAIGLDYKLKRIVNGELKPLIGTPRFSQAYKRKKKNKVLVSGDTASEYVMNPDSLLLGFEQIFSIDTNTWVIGKNKISVAGVIYAFVEDEGRDTFVLKFAPLTLFEFWDAEVKPELLGWYALVQAILANEDLCGKRTALIVDSELGDIQEINERKLPIVNDFYLPEKIKLIYATADSGASIANKLIKLSDRFSSDKLKEIKNNRMLDSLKETDYPCRLFRQWLR